MLHSPVSWRSSAFSLVPLVAALGCQGSIGAHSGSGGHMGATGQAGGSITGVAGGTGNVGITGIGGGGGTVDPTVAACMASNGALNAGLTPARRLTRDQLNNTVRDLIGATGTPADALGPDEKIGPFNSNAIAVVDDTLVQQHAEIAASLAVAAKARMAQIAPCDLTTDTGTSTTCATRFVTEFGKRAYRRPLDATEIATYVSLYTLGKQGADAANGFRLVVEAMLQSPFFLYHHDVGATGTPQGGTVAITPYELASRLSYFLWNTMPDDTLFARAADGTLATDAVPGLRGAAHAGQRQGGGDDRALPPPVARRHRAARPDEGCDGLPALQRAARRRDDAGAGDVLGLRRPQGRRSLEDVADVEPLVPAGRPVRPLRRRAAGRLQGGRFRRAGRQQARRHPDAGGVPDPLGPRQPDVARPSRQAGAPQRDVRLRAAAAGEREHEPARADGDDVDARSASRSTTPTRTAPAATS